MTEAVHFLNPDGQVIAVDADQAPIVANARDYTLATPEQIKQYKATQKYGGAGQQAIAAAEGIARGLSARLSTAAEVGLGVDPEDIRGRMEAHPLTSLGTEVLGTGAGLLGAAVSAPALIAKAGAATAGVTARALGPATGLAGRIARAAATTGAAGAAEGALYGAGNVVHEAALGDPDLTAQGVLGHVGMTAALGGTLGGVIGGGAGALKVALGKARSAAAELASGISTPEKLAKTTQAQHDAMGHALTASNRVIRPEETAALISASTDTAQNEALRLATRIDEMASSMRAQPELCPSKMFPAKLEAIRDGLLRTTKDQGAAEVFSALNDAKGNLDKQLGKWGKFIAPEHQDAIAAIRGVRGEIKSSLESEAIWGKAGARQAAFNDAQAEWLDAAKGFRKTFMTEKIGRGIRPTYEADPAKLNLLSDTANLRTPARQAIWDRFQGASKDLLDQIEVSSQHSPVTGFDKTAVEGLINKTGTMVQKAKQQGSVLRMLDKVSGAVPGGAIVGSVLGGPVGTAIGAGVDIVMKGAKMIPRAVDVLSKLHANNEAITAAIERGTAGVLRGGAKVARGEASAGIARAFGQDAETASAAHEKYVDKLRKLTADPAQMGAALEAMVADIHEHAPKTSQSMQITAARAVSFLASKIPPVQRAGPLGEALPPTQESIASFNRYREAVEHPLSVLDQAKAGTLTREGLEALHAVYPHLSQKIQAAAVDHLASAKDVPRSAMIAFSQILGKDLDGTTMPSSVPMPAPVSRQTPGGPRATPAKAGKITLHERMQLNSKQALGRER